MPACPRDADDAALVRTPPGPFPTPRRASRPATLVAFCRHTRGAERWLLLMAIATTGLIAIAEVALYAYVGALVDRMNALGVARFLAAEGPRLAAMARWCCSACRCWCG